MKFKLKKLYIFAIVCIISLIAAFGIKSVNSKKSDMSAEMRDFSLEKNIDILDYYYGENDYDLKEEKSMIKDELKNASDNSVVVKVVQIMVLLCKRSMFKKFIKENANIKKYGLETRTHGLLWIKRGL